MIDNSILERAWFDALSVARKTIDSHDVQPIWDAVGTKLQYNAQAYAVMLEESGGLRISPVFRDTPFVEKVEVLSFAALAIHFNNLYAGDAFRVQREAFQHLCFRAGCWHTNTVNVAERWRLIDYYQNWRSSPVAEFEAQQPRHACTICRGLIATGAGAWMKDQPRYGSIALPWDKVFAAEAQNRPTDDDYPWYRRDIHYECLRYAHRVLAPLMRKQRQEQIAAQIAAKQDGPSNLTGE